MASAPTVALCTLLAAAVCGCSGLVTGYSGAPIEGRVIDGATRQPLAGVIVVARWKLEGFLHGEDAGNLHLAEAVSAGNGSYQFAAWGPRRPPGGTSLDARAPRLYFFKPGYALRQLANDESGVGPAAAGPRVSQWRGVDVELTPPPDPMVAQSIAAQAFRALLAASDACAWEQVPRFTAAALREAQAGGRAGAAVPSLASLWLGEPTFEPIESLDRNRVLKKSCADPRIALKEFL